MRIEIAGDVGDGVIIKNHTTGECCKFVAIGSATFDGEENYVALDSISGKCYAHTEGTDKIAFLYHGGGFITLIPAFPIRRNMFVSAMHGSDTIQSVGKLYDRNNRETPETAEADLKGQHIWLGDAWHEIAAVTDEHNMKLTEPLESSASGTTMTTRMNRITVEPVSTMKLTRLNFVYKPTFS